MGRGDTGDTCPPSFENQRKSPSSRLSRACSSSERSGGPLQLSEPGRDDNHHSITAGRPHCGISTWPLPHPWKTKQSFFERDVRSYSTSICNRDQQAGTEPGQCLRLATVSPTPTPTVYQPNQRALPAASCQVAEEAHWAPPPNGVPGQG